MAAYSLLDKPVVIYYSCAQEDYELFKKLDKLLNGLRRQGLIHTFHHRSIMPGEQKEVVIASYLEQSQMILLLLSPDYLAEDRYYAELERAIQREKAGECRVLPVLLRPTPWRETVAGYLQPLPTAERSVTGWANLDEALANVYEGIYREVKHI